VRGSLCPQTPKILTTKMIEDQGSALKSFKIVIGFLVHEVCFSVALVLTELIIGLCCKIGPEASSWLVSITFNFSAH